MISKRLIYIAVGILIFILVATICPDCAESGSYEELEWQKSKKLAEGMNEEEATKAAKEIVRKDEEEFEEYDDEPYADEYDEEELFPDEPITYSGDALGLNVILTVNFKTTEVTGSINLTGDDYIDATINNGKIDIETLEIASTFSGIMGSKEYGQEHPFNGTITGTINEDLNIFNGEIRDDEGEGGEFTLTK